MLTTLLPPTAGTARVGGFDVVSEGPQVRASIGAALQEAALDPLLTGREHMRLQTALHGLGKGEREARGDELLERVGLAEAADRKVGGYSGGMKRRLDLALALAHRPRILFLDEPTTGLDIQSRTALWEEVARLAGRGRRDRLPHHPVPRGGRRARRPGRDHRPRPHRRRGHAGGAEGRDRPPDGRGDPPRPGRARADGRRCSAASASRAGTAPRGVAVRLAGGESELAEVVRALDSEGIAIEHLQLHAPSLDDVFLDQDRPLARGRRARPRRRTRTPRRVASGVSGGLAHPGRAARPPLGAAHPAPAGAVRPGDDLPALPARGERRRPQRRDQPARLPDRLLPHLRPRGPLHPGRPLLGDELGHRPRPRHRDRLPQPPGADPAARRRAAQRPARRRRSCSASSRRSSTSSSG